jgi:2-keto-4-pentenoate hydratase/2-oxohepta-3-ene-1,7-dioic acid hydratase in catechol pathway
LAVGSPGGEFRGFDESEATYPSHLGSIIAEGAQALRGAAKRRATGGRIDPEFVEWLPISYPGQIICIGLNHVDHSIESGFVPPSYPTVFAWFCTSLIGYGAAIRRLAASIQLDYEGEMVAVIGETGRHVAQSRALEHVAGYSIVNDASIRDFPSKSPQSTIGEKLDGAGSFGPVFVTADELPPGAKGLRIQTRLNGRIVQSASTNDLIFEVAALVSTLSEAITLLPGDIIVTDAPAGVGASRKPQLFMRHGDVCEVELEAVGVLSNAVADDSATAHAVTQ